MEEGDIIKINIPENKIELAVSDEVACKKESRVETKKTKGYNRLFGRDMRRW